MKILNFDEFYEYSKSNTMTSEMLLMYINELVDTNSLHLKNRFGTTLELDILNNLILNERYELLKTALSVLNANCNLGGVYVEYTILDMVENMVEVDETAVEILKSFGAKRGK